jgi:hypothetical protein
MKYQISTQPQKTMFGKRTGSIVARLESDYSYNVASAAGPNATFAKQALINQLGMMASNTERAYLFCGDSKTVLVVSFAGESWQYDIISADRVSRSGCIMPGVSSFREAKDRAYEHAEQSYGGILNAL